MKKILILIALVFMVGCSFTIDEHEVRAMQEGCKLHDGIDYMETINIRARCRDGAWTE